MTGRFALRCVAMAAVAALSVAVPLHAENWPARPIKIVMPFPAGGQPDTIARLIAQHLTGSVGATVVDNRPGGSTMIGTRAVAAAEPDGYTLLFGSSTSLAIVPAMTSNPGYDPVKSFTPIVGVSRSPMVLVVGASVPVKTAAELVAYAKANPGKLNFAAPPGGPPTLAAEAFKRTTGIDIMPVSYRGMNQAFTDMLGGQIQILFDSPAPIVPLLHEGKMRALAILNETRIAELPDVPTMVESGLPDLRMVTWNGLVAPAGTPDAIIAKLNTAVNDALKAPETKSTLSNFGSEPLGGTPQEFAAFIKTQSGTWGEIVRLSGAKLD
ncbi:MAG: tripartite tricarboxylate transporter substrate binding protein [Pseudolabrys sp.]|nr:tripartite tricarboxylate transporter substrate binding protein [Pseudolabrys sp.]